jgi:short-subunit dehydrogenase
MSGPKALITGASAGIGAALARRMAGRGVEVWLAARRPEKLAAEVEAIAQAGGAAHAVQLDVTAPETCARAVEKLDEEVGGLDVVVANAGVGGGGRRVSRLRYEDAAQVFQTNLLGALATILPLVPRMVERKRGHIVGISSLAADIPLPVAADYGASKAALNFFLESAQGDLPQRGVDVTIVQPGYIKTDLTAANKFPMPFLMELDDAVRIIDDGIARRARRVRFPLGLVALIGVGRKAPVALRARAVGR